MPLPVANTAMSSQGPRQGLCAIAIAIDAADRGFMKLHVHFSDGECRGLMS